ncbi:hypothetical protein ABXN37_10870 [Piscinibacter sakaiensis]|uniref:hypothetical protein n=1 Tax=Piscinibacter sakaiensis TaxID=1547922 RepID=UPI003728A5FB
MTRRAGQAGARLHASDLHLRLGGRDVLDGITLAIAPGWTARPSSWGASPTSACSARPARATPPPSTARWP